MRPSSIERVKSSGYWPTQPLLSDIRCCLAKIVHCGRSCFSFRILREIHGSTEMSFQLDIIYHVGGTVWTGIFRQSLAYGDATGLLEGQAGNSANMLRTLLSLSISGQWAPSFQMRCSAVNSEKRRDYLDGTLFERPLASSARINTLATFCHRCLFNTDKSVLTPGLL